MDLCISSEQLHPLYSKTNYRHKNYNTIEAESATKYLFRVKIARENDEYKKVLKEIKYRVLWFLP